MNQIKTTLNKETLKKTLNLIIDESSSYVLIENGDIGINNKINIFFDPNDLTQTKNLLQNSGYYQSIKTDHLIGKINEDVHLIPLSKIIYIEGINNDTYATTHNNEYKIKDKLYELEIKLKNEKFVRISKSFIVSVNSITKIKPTFNGKLVLFMNNNTKLEVSRHFLQSFKTYLGM